LIKRSGKAVGKSIGIKIGSSSGAFSMTDSNSVKSGSVKGNPNNDSFDLEDFDDIVEKI
jgi:hypothetical protein